MRERLWTVATCAAFAMVLAVPLLWAQPAAIGIYDEGIILTGALHWSHGEATGADFYTTYGPLQFALVAAVLERTDWNFLAPRILYALTLGMAIVALSIGSRPREDYLSLLRTLTFACLGLLICSLYGSPLYPNHSLAAICAVILLAKVHAAVRPSWTVVVVGLGVAAAVLARPAVGALLAVGLLVSLPLEMYADSKYGGPPARVRAAVLAAALLLASVIVLGVDAATGGSVRGVAGLIANVHAGFYAEYRGLPFPGLPRTSRELSRFVLAWYPVVVVPCGGAVLLAMLAGRLDHRSSDVRRIYWLCFFTALLFSLAIVRTDGAHLMPSALFAVALTLHGVRLLRLRGRAFALLCALVVVCSMGAGVMWFALDRTALRPTVLSVCGPLASRTEHESCPIWGSRRRAVVAALDEMLEPGERILSANSRHDLIFHNNQSYYALAGRLPLTYWAHMDPGLQTTKAVQETMVNDIKRQITRRGRAVVIVEDVDHRIEPNLSATPSGIHVLDAYLAGCKAVFSLDNTSILLCPA